MKEVVCNVPIENEDVSSLLPRASDSNGIVIVKLKRKLEYKGHMYFESVRRQFIFNLLNYLHNNLYTGITINTENISNSMSTLTDPNNDSDELIQELIHSINTPISIVLEKQHILYYTILSDQHCDELAHPYLFPTGKYGYKFDRDIPLSPVKYFNQRLLNYTQKFASDADYIFFVHSIL